MIRKSSSQTYASELLIESTIGDRRPYVREALDKFGTYLAEDCIASLMRTGQISGEIPVRDFLYVCADEWLATEAGREFVRQLAANTEEDA